MEVRRITWTELKKYWERYNHFGDNKKYDRVVTQLGPYKCQYENPRCQAYGLFDRTKLIGVTQLTEWSKTWTRHRTIRISKSYRGRKLGWYLLLGALEDGWHGFQHNFGWVREDRIHFDYYKPFKKISPFVDDGYSNVKHCGILAKVKDIRYCYVDWRKLQNKYFG